MQIESTGTYIAPRSLIEEKLVRIWSELLGVRVGIYDNFFELGGHSLLATQLNSRIRDACGVELPLRSLFEAPAIAQLAKVVESLSGEAKQTPAIMPLGCEAHRRLRSSLNSEQGR